MNRRHLTFACDGALLAGTIDMGAATGTTGLLIVSGGNEIRAGAWGGQAQLSARLARAGVPVFRFDRRGVGESEGANGGFRASRDDIAAALAAFRQAAPQVRRIVAFGNCDAATALALHHHGLGIDALVLANPWTIDSDGDGAGDDTAVTMPAAAIRQRYLAKLTNPREVLRLLTGGVNLAKLARGLRGAGGTAPPPSSLARDIAGGIAAFVGPLTILLATGDRTAQMFMAGWPSSDPRVERIASASHSFSDDAARDWLHARLMAALG